MCETKNRVLLLIGKNNEMFSNLTGVDVDDIYKKGWINRYLRHIPLLAYYSLEKWKKKTQIYDVVIVIDSILTKEALYAIIYFCKSKRIILWFRNKISSRNEKWNIYKIKNKVEIWSYNIHDCSKYNLKYNIQALKLRAISKYRSKGEDYAYILAFLGMNKSRITLLQNLEKYLSDRKMSTFFYVPDAPTLRNNKCRNGKLLTYQEYLHMLSISKAILDLVTNENWGLTYRPIEAIMLEKKLVTNYTDIVNYDFYRKENIFVLGIDKIENLEKFLNTEYVALDDRYMNEYDVNSCMDNFVMDRKVMY